ncbi:MAG: hypothetical protein JNM43_05875 [Planctomycetaceae bacterium]|nr:hypothetical protein [Planctomycetaceae bacterium]
MTSGTAQGQRRGRWWFRLAAIVCALLPFVFLEIVCRVAGWGAEDLHRDPFVGFAATRPLFELSNDRATMQIAQSRRGFFKPDSFAVQKAPDEFRIFVVGGSTVQGSPFSTETSFPAFTALALNAISSDKTWKTVNCGGVSYASYRIAPILEECLQYEPDLIIFCEGHNEFLEDVSYVGRKQTSNLIAPLYSAASKLQSFRAIESLMAHSGSSDSGQPILNGEVTTRLDQAEGLSAYHRDDAHASMVAEHYRANLIRMCRMCRQANVPLLVIRPSANLADCPPFKSEFSAELSEAERNRIADLLHQSRQFLSEQKWDDAQRCLNDAVTQDPRYALSWYELGQWHRSRGNSADALRCFQRAVDEDVCPLRMTTPLVRVMREVTSAEQVPLLDAHELLATLSPQQLPGDFLLVDHVHPSFRGHEEIAVAIAKWMQQTGLAPMVDAAAWEQSARDACRQRVQSMSDTYFLQGRRQLEILKRWAAGRSQEPEFAPDGN